MSDLEGRYRRLFWLLVAGLTVFRLALAGLVGLSTDESHYVMYARHPAWGYLDHPPLVGFMGAAFLFLHENAFFARLGPIVCSAASLLLLRGLALAMYGSEKIALLAVVCLLLMPIQHLLGVALLPDAPLNLFWCAALWLAWLAIRDGRPWHWVLLGLMFGGALLSKYHGALLPVCLAGYVLTSASGRRRLGRPWPYVAGLIGLAVFAPNILWNYQNGWVSYLFQIGRGAGSGEFSLAKVAASLGGQLAAASPLVLLLFLAACVWVWRSRAATEADRFLMWTSLPVLVIFCGIGMTGRILPHWPAVGWWAGSVLLASVLVRNVGPAAKPAVARRWKAGAGFAAAVAVPMLIGIYSAIAYPVVTQVYPSLRRATLVLHRRFPFVQPLEEFKPQFDITNDMYGWDQTARAVERIRAGMPDPGRTFVCTHRFYTMSQIGACLPREVATTSLEKRVNQYHLWFDPARHAGWDALFVEDNHYPGRMESYSNLFEHVVQEPVAVDVYRRGMLAHQQQVYRCHGFKGERKGERKHEEVRK